jgi:YD repeat-containing protein
MRYLGLAHGAAVVAAIVVCASLARAATTYTYDELGRVITVTYDNGNQIVYVYDAAGNRTVRTVGPAASTQLPTATADIRTITQGTASDVFDPRVANGSSAADTAPTGQTLTIVGVTPGQFGQATVTNNGTRITYATPVTRTVTDEVVYTIRTTERFRHDHV